MKRATVSKSDIQTQNRQRQKHRYKKNIQRQVIRERLYRNEDETKEL